MSEANSTKIGMLGIPKHPLGFTSLCTGVIQYLHMFKFSPAYSRFLSTAIAASHINQVCQWPSHNPSHVIYRPRTEPGLLIWEVVILTIRVIMLMVVCPIYPEDEASRDTYIGSLATEWHLVSLSPAESA